jgi:ribonuclease HI
MSESSRYKNFKHAKQLNPDLPNIGKPWTTEQENLLMKKISEGKSYEEISKDFGRTVGGITSRLKQIACDMVELGKSLQYASEKTTMSVGDIKKTIIGRNNSKMKKEEKESKSKMKKEEKESKYEKCLITEEMPYKLYFDGKAEPNPGKGSGGAVCYNGLEEVFRVGKYLPQTTNNQAEYIGLIIGLKECIKLGIKSVEVFGDSNLVIEQSAGRWKVNNEILQGLNAQVKTLVKEFSSITFTHILRNKNTVADEITNIVYAQEKDLGMVESVFIKKNCVEDDIKEIKNDIKELKQMLKSLIEGVVE